MSTPLPSVIFPPIPLCSLAHAALLVMLCSLLFARPAHALAPGIPVPSFGIQESAGPYTHYVDNSVACSDSNNNGRGSAAAPRCTIPTSLAAGNVVEVRGGPYTGSALNITSNGTPSAPAFLRGPGSSARPKILNRSVGLSGTYLIVEYLDFDHSPLSAGAGSNFVAIRHCEMHNKHESGSVVNISGASGNPSQNVIVYRNNLHDNGDILSTTEADNHAVKPGRYSGYVWILENTISGSGGDSIQVGGATYSDLERPRFVYIGDNIMHEDRENAVDIKAANDIVVSSNVMYGYRATSSSSGEAVILHNGSVNVWLINNDISDSINGIVSTGADGVYVMGNVIRDILRDPSDTETGASAHRNGLGIKIYSTSNLHIYNNTIVNTIIGAAVEMNGSALSVRMANNIVQNVNLSADGYHVIAYGNSTALANSSISNVMAYQPGGTALVSIAGGMPTSGVQQNVNPLLLVGYRLDTNSPAIGAGASALPAYSTFQSLYGLSISVDRTGLSRPNATTWDLGAYEYNAESPPVPNACDLNGNGVSVTDVQLCSNQAINVTTCMPASQSGSGDINQDNQCNVVDVQRVVNAALGGSCVTQ